MMRHHVSVVTRSSFRPALALRVAFAIPILVVRGMSICVPEPVLAVIAELLPLVGVGRNTALVVVVLVRSAVLVGVVVVHRNIAAHAHIAAVGGVHIAAAVRSVHHTDTAAHLD